MRVDFRTVNTVWASVVVETLRRLGLSYVVLSPGSRSTPLALALAAAVRDSDGDMQAIPVLDERSAAFFALGLAKQTQRPVVLVCTSGTAGVNYFPAVVEAWASCVPLIVLTTDRPPELRDCYSGQTIDQLRLYGNYPNWQTELAVPELDLGQLRYLRQTVVHAWRRSLQPVPGIVHLNVPFRDPLPPIADGRAQAFQTHFPGTFFEGLSAWQPPPAAVALPVDLLQRWTSSSTGLIVAGPVQPADPEGYCQAIARISKALGWPVLAEGLSPLRNFAPLNPHQIAHYDFILRNAEALETLTPEYVLQVGPLPTSKMLRQWLADGDFITWQVDDGDRNLDALHNRTTPLAMDLFGLARAMVGKSEPSSPYLESWLKADRQVGIAIDALMGNCDRLCEGKVAWLLSQVLPSSTPLFIANSTAVRDVEWFWRPAQTQVQPFVNRGANGIDGTLSTALGMAYQNRPAVLLTGDLALLHDTNGFLLRSHFQGHLTIVLVNNNGGGIFNLLPISQFEPPFEEFFATPQDIDFGRLCHTYSVDYERIETWEQLSDRLSTLPASGIRLLELVTNRQQDAAWRLNTFAELAASVSLDG